MNPLGSFNHPPAGGLELLRLVPWAQPFASAPHDGFPTRAAMRVAVSRVATQAAPRRGTG